MAYPSWISESSSETHEWDSYLQFLNLKEESLVNAFENSALNTSLWNVHTARRFFRLIFNVNCEEFFKSPWTLNIGGRKSRNKVAVGEPAAGSFIWSIVIFCQLWSNICRLVDVSERKAKKNVMWHVVSAESWSFYAECSNFLLGAASRQLNRPVIKTLSRPIACWYCFVNQTEHGLLSSYHTEFKHIIKSVEEITMSPVVLAKELGWAPLKAVGHCRDSLRKHCPVSGLKSPPNLMIGRHPGMCSVW